MRHTYGRQFHLDIRMTVHVLMSVCGRQLFLKRGIGKEMVRNDGGKFR
jgi:hypothetical protein